MLSITSHREMQIKATVRQMPLHNHRGEHHQKDRWWLLTRMQRHWDFHMLPTGTWVVQQLWKTLWQFLKRLNIEWWYDTWACTQETESIGSHKNSHTDIHSSIIHFSPRVETTQKSIIWRMHFLKKCVLGNRWPKPSARPDDNCLPELSHGRRSPWGTQCCLEN